MFKKLITLVLTICFVFFGLAASDIVEASNVIGETTEYLNGEAYDLMTGETNFGSLVTDIMRSSTNADIAMINGMSIGASIEAGEITEEKLQRTFPYNEATSIVVIEVTGEEIREALNHSVSEYPSPARHFLQVSGLSFTYDVNKDGGDRIIDVNLEDDLDFEEDKVYRLAINNLLANGGFGYLVFYSKEKITHSRSLIEEISNYIEERNMIYPFVQNRIHASYGKTAVNLEGPEACESGETGFGNLVADVMKKVVNADVALFNGGAVMDPVEEGTLMTHYNLEPAKPFGNYVVAIELTGQDIWDAIEHGIDEYPVPAGKFPQISGMTYTFDASKEPGNRLLEVRVDGEPLQMDKDYELATNEFMADGGDLYHMFADKKIIRNTENLIQDILDYTKEQGGVIEPEVEGRINILND